MRASSTPNTQPNTQTTRTHGTGHAATVKLRHRSNHGPVCDAQGTIVANHGLLDGGQIDAPRRPRNPARLLCAGQQRTELGVGCLWRVERDGACEPLVGEEERLAVVALHVPQAAERDPGPVRVKRPVVGVAVKAWRVGPWRQQRATTKRFGGLSPAARASQHEERNPRQATPALPVRAV